MKEISLKDLKYRNIVFDVDGTLMDTEYAVLHSLQDTIRTLSGEEVPCLELQFALGIPGIDALKKLNMKNIPYAIGLWEQILRGYADTVTVFDGISELLKKLLELDREMGIVTSRTRHEFEYEFSHFDIRHYFKTIVCADDTQEHKPTAAPLLKYAEWAKTDRQKILYIGDSEYDSKCAQNAGINFALAVWGSHSKHIKANYYLEKPADLLSLISIPR